MEDKFKHICDFYATTAKLKNLIRSGWKLWDISAERLESVAEHIYGTQMLAFAFANEFGLKLNLNKVLVMLAFHELGECLVGDITIHDNISKEQKHQMELNAVSQILSPLAGGGVQILKLFNEFEEQKTQEAIFAHLIDKLECDMQVKFYEENGNTNYTQVRTGSVEQYRQKGLKTGCKTFAEMWVRADQHKNKFDENFNNLLEYVLSHNIFKKD